MSPPPPAAPETLPPLNAAPRPESRLASPSPSSQSTLLERDLVPAQAARPASPTLANVLRLTQATPSDPAPTPAPQTPGAEIPLPEDDDAAPIPGTSAPAIPDIPLTPSTPPGTPTPAPGAAPVVPPQPAAQEPQVLVGEVVVDGVTGELETIVYDAIQTRAGRTTTRSQLQADINAIFATGYFANVRAVPEDTPLGVRVTFVVEPNPVLRAVQVQDSQVLPQEVVDRAFAPQIGQILNLRRFQEGVQTLNTWYRENGYVLAQITDAPQVSPEGTATLTVAEGIIEDITIRFVTEEGEDVDDEGKPIQGRTREFIITREFQSQPGEVFNQQRIQADLQRAFGLGIFQDLQIQLNPGQDPRQVDVTVNVVERNTGSLALGGGISSASGLFGTVSYQEQNLGGNNQRLSAEIQVGQREAQFDIGFTDPWIGGDPFRTSYTVNAFSRRSVPLVFQGGEEDEVDPVADVNGDGRITLPNGERPRILRLGGGISFGRPDDPFDPTWRYSLGLQYQRVRIQDADGTLSPVDEAGNDLSFSGTGTDDIFSVIFAATTDNRNNPAAPTRGSLLRFSTEQTIPVGEGSIFFNRLRASYSYFIPVNFLTFSEGPQALAFNVQGGIVLGDLPPYEAFSLGGTDSIRGYGSGDVGSGRAFLLGSVEYRFPIFSVVGGALFLDVGSDLGTGDNVPGNPAGIRGKPGFGFGVGVGVRIQSPLGAIRIDYAVNDDGDSRIHFGIGERF